MLKLHVHGVIVQLKQVYMLCIYANSKTMWRAVGLDKLVSCVEQENPKVVVERVFKQDSREQCVEVAMLCWSLWHRRNR